MTWLVISIVLVLAALGPFFGADSREGAPACFAHLWRGRRQNAR